jgi:hypothetical protein
MTYARDVPNMNSIAAYYALIAVNSMEQETAQRRGNAKAAPVARPSLLARARALLASTRTAQSAATPG